MKTTREIEEEENIHTLWICIFFIIIMCFLSGWITYKIVMTRINPQTETSYTYFFQRM